MEVAYEEVLHAELGAFRFAYDARGRLLRIDLPGRGAATVGRSARPSGTPPRKQVERWLERSLGGEKARFPGEWVLPGNSEFVRAVYQHVHGIPAGSTCSYGEVAAACGSPRAARAVGNAMAQNPLPILVPCHRVVSSQGLGGFGGGLPLKRILLKHEGTPLLRS